MSTCRSCPAEIDWAVSDSTSKRIPIDHQPDPDGLLAVRRDEETGELRARSAPAGAPLRPGEKRGTSHFATCPDADEHRRPR